MGGGRRQRGAHAPPAHPLFTKFHSQESSHRVWFLHCPAYALVSDWFARFAVRARSELGVAGEAKTPGSAVTNSAPLHGLRHCTGLEGVGGVRQAGSGSHVPLVPLPGLRPCTGLVRAVRGSRTLKTRSGGEGQKCWGSTVTRMCVRHCADYAIALVWVGGGRRGTAGGVGVPCPIARLTRLYRFGSRGSRFAHAQNSEWRERRTRRGSAVTRCACAIARLTPLHWFGGGRRGKAGGVGVDAILHCTSTYLHIFQFFQIY